MWSYQITFRLIAPSNIASGVCGYIRIFPIIETRRPNCHYFTKRKLNEYRFSPLHSVLSVKRLPPDTVTVSLLSQQGQLIPRIDFSIRNQLPEQMTR